MSSDKPNINRDNTKQVFDSKYIKVFDFQYEEGRHYYDATRRDKDDLVVFKSDEEFKNMLPDAVTCIIVITGKAVDEPKLLLTYEFRYPAGQFLLCPTAGIMDPSDKEAAEPLFETAKREIREETGITITDNCKFSVVSPLLFSTPGMTDESNAIVLCEIELDDLSQLSTDNSEDSEHFNGFELYSKEEARKILLDGRDKNGRFYSVYTWIALSWFVMNW